MRKKRKEVKKKQDRFENASEYMEYSQYSNNNSSNLTKQMGMGQMSEGELMDLCSGFQVVKRNGKFESVDLFKIYQRIRSLSNMGKRKLKLGNFQLLIKVINQLRNRISTEELDRITAEQCAVMTSTNPDYGILAGRIVISNHIKKTEGDFVELTQKLQSLLSPAYLAFIQECEKRKPGVFQEMIDEDRDYLIDYFGFKTLERSYLLQQPTNNNTNNTTLTLTVKDGGETTSLLHPPVYMERPQHLWMRVAIGIHGLVGPNDLVLLEKDDGSGSGAKDAAIQASLQHIRRTYNDLSLKRYIHATPTLFNAGTVRPQLASCFLVSMESDSITGIFNSLSECAHISKMSGGIGISCHNLRSRNSVIHTTNGKTTGIAPVLQIYNNTARYVNQGGKRNGSIAVYLEVWHYDVTEFLELRKNRGDENMKARDLFYALWICDLFMERVKSDKNETWTLFSPDQCPELFLLYGKEFEAKYIEYEACPDKVRGTIDAKELWTAILNTQMETSMPYLLFKDASNYKSNQKNLGTIRSSNLCCEIMEYSDEKETAVCNLASLALPTFVNTTTKTIDWSALQDTVKQLTYNLNRVIDVGLYPSPKCSSSNFRHRPLGIGVQGLANVFMMLGYPFESAEAAQCNRLLFEHIYFAALQASMELAKEHGPYDSFAGSPASQGKLQFDLWQEFGSPSSPAIVLTLPWEDLKKEIMTHGLRNSLLIALMPTASTSQILGFNECFEPITSNLYTRTTLAGDFIVVNSYLVKDLQQLGLWDESMRQAIIANDGSVQVKTEVEMENQTGEERETSRALNRCFVRIPESVRAKFKIVWEMKMKTILDMAAARGPFCCQSQSMNLWVAKPSLKILHSMYVYAHSLGLKTGCYYLRRKSAIQSAKVTLNADWKTTTNPLPRERGLERGKREQGEEETTASYEDDVDDECTMCSA